MVTNLTKILKNLEIENLNKMQVEAHKTISNAKNTLLLSPTGSGKTLAFLLPIFQNLDANLVGVQCLILVPTRELVLQIEKVWKKMATGFKVNMCYGGHSLATEINNLSSPPALLIGTPGRIADHLQRKSFDVKNIKTLILDEFDKSLELGFHEQMSEIIAELKFLEKRILVSATSDIDIPDFTGVENPKILDFVPKEKETTKLSLTKVISEEKDKLNALFTLICNLNSESALIFCNHREAAERISDALVSKNISSTYYHGGMDQDERERALIQFRNGSVSYLVTTDLAARGLDIPEMKHVIHYHLPSKEDEFTHRNGRTARMLSTGTAYILVHLSENLPYYLDENLPIFELDDNAKLPNSPEFLTIYISGGKKNKLNKIDIVGFFSQKGNLQKGDLGLIEVKDFESFAAVKSSKITEFFQNIKDEKMKGKKYKIEIARKVIKREED